MTNLHDLEGNRYRRKCRDAAPMMLHRAWALQNNVTMQERALAWRPKPSKASKTRSRLSLNDIYTRINSCRMSVYLCVVPRPHRMVVWFLRQLRLAWCRVIWYGYGYTGEQLFRNFGFLLHAESITTLCRKYWRPLRRFSQTPYCCCKDGDPLRLWWNLEILA